ncbi:MAG: tetratricopeptide (TPR) repeat protein [Sulfurimonas sp.]|jgi:tetratricopeptide (TPR) repeat protein
MNGIRKHKTLTQAKDYFSKSDYKSALERFAVVLQDFPNSKEAYNGVILSEMALSGEGGAEALFDYYEILKDEDKESADNIMSDILQTMDGTVEKLSEVFAEPLRERLEFEDGILYQDFRAILDKGAGFKETFENIMFSTRVIITQKEDFIDFLENLIEHGFAEMALTYLENALSVYPSDELLRKLLKKLAKSKKSEN